MDKSGKGSAVYSNGNKYVGNIENDMKNGYGTYQWVNGHRYDRKLEG